MADLNINDPSFSEITPDNLTINDKALVDGRSLRLFVVMMKMLERQYHTGTQLASTISNFQATVSVNTTVGSNTTAASNAQSAANSAQSDATQALSDASNAQSTANSAQADIDLVTIIDNGNIITNAQIAQVLRFSRQETKQVISGATPTLNTNNGYNADFAMTGNAVINITNLPASLVGGGYIILRDTNSYTISLQLNGVTTNVAKMVNAEDLPAGASDTAILTWIYDGTYLTYNIGKRTEA